MFSPLPLPDNDNNADHIGLVLGLFCGWGLDWNGIHDLTAKYADADKVSHMDIPPSKYHSLVLREENKEISVNLDEVTACPPCLPRLYRYDR